MKLPIRIRETIVEELDEMLESYNSDPDSETVVNYLLEQLEILADEEGIDDLLVDLEEEAALDSPMVESLEAEMNSNDEFEYTGEEVISLLERVCEIEWIDDVSWDEADDEDSSLIDEDEL